MIHSKRSNLVHPWHTSLNNAGGILLETEQKRKLFFFFSTKYSMKIGTMSTNITRKGNSPSISVDVDYRPHCCGAKKISWWLSTGTCQIHFTRCWQPGHIYPRSIWDWTYWMVDFENKHKNNCANNTRNSAFNIFTLAAYMIISSLGKNNAVGSNMCGCWKGEGVLQEMILSIIKRRLICTSTSSIEKTSFITRYCQEALGCC